MCLVEKKGLDAPRHLVVFITSEEDFSEQIAQLQSRNFDVEVLYHHPSASKKPVSITHAANQAYDWLPFLRHHLHKPNLTLTYDPSLFQQPRQPFSSGQAKGPVVGAPLQPIPRTHVQPTALGPKVPPQGQSDGCAPDTVQSGPSASISALIQLHGLIEGHLSIPRQCHSLLAQHMSQQVADNTVITVLEGWDGPFAVLDFSKAAQPAQQAANAVTALNGRVWSVSKLHVQLYKDGSTASGSSNHSNLPIPAASAKAASLGVPMNNGPVNNGYKGNCDGYKGGSNGYKGNGQGYQANAGGNTGACRPAHNASGYALNDSQAATPQCHNGGYQRAYEGGYLGGYQGGYKGPIGNASHLFNACPSGVQPYNRCSEAVTKDDQQSCGAASKGPAGVASNSTEPVQKRETAHDSIGAPSSGDTAAISGPSALGAIASKRCSADDNPYRLHDGTFDGTNSNESCQAINFADAVTWGFDGALGGKYEMFPPEQCAYLQEQWNKLQCMDLRDQAVSEHRCNDVLTT